MKHKELIELGKKFLKRKGKFWTSPVVFTELQCAGIEIPDVMGFHSTGTSIIEAKTSRNDFLRDKKKTSRQYDDMGMGKHRFYICEEGLIKENEVPNNWGLLYANPITKKVRLVLTPIEQERNTRMEQAYMYSIIRRLNSFRKKPDEIIKFFEKYG